MSQSLEHCPRRPIRNNICCQMSRVSPHRQTGLRVRSILSWFKWRWCLSSFCPGLKSPNVWSPESQNMNKLWNQSSQLDLLIAKILSEKFCRILAHSNRIQQEKVEENRRRRGGVFLEKQIEFKRIRTLNQSCVQSQSRKLLILSFEVVSCTTGLGWIWEVRIPPPKKTVVEFPAIQQENQTERAMSSQKS